MTLRPLLQRLTDSEAWRPSLVVRNTLVADVTRDDAIQFTTAGAARDTLERFLDHSQSIDPSLRELVLLVRGRDGHFEGVIAVRLSPSLNGGFDWDCDLRT